MRYLERALTDRERDVLSMLASVDQRGSDVVRESLPHLVVTGRCECGRASFNVRDDRSPAQSHHLSHFSNGVSNNLHARKRRSKHRRHRTRTSSTRH